VLWVGFGHGDDAGVRNRNRAQIQRGICGLLMSVPMVTTVKAVCTQMDDLQPIGELLGN
jgi:hypothetical protein